MEKPPSNMDKLEQEYHQALTAWQDTKALYIATWQLYRTLPPELNRVVANQMSTVDMVQRRLIEGFNRSTVVQFIHFLKIGQSALREAICAHDTYRSAGHFIKSDGEQWRTRARKIDAGFTQMRLGMRGKRYLDHTEKKGWIKEVNDLYACGHMV